MALVEWEHGAHHFTINDKNWLPRKLGFFPGHFTYEISTENLLKLFHSHSYLNCLVWFQNIIACTNLFSSKKLQMKRSIKYSSVISLCLSPLCHGILGFRARICGPPEFAWCIVDPVRRVTKRKLKSRMRVVQPHWESPAAPSVGYCGRGASQEGSVCDLRIFGSGRAESQICSW